MISRQQLELLQSNVASLGARRLAVLAAAGLLILSGVVAGSYYLGKPPMEALYVGLSGEDVSRMGAALQEAGIRFDVNAEGTKILVVPGEAARARMLLAEKGLPSSNTAGYELFDKLGSMSLTTFMQNITRLRALEGEIARTVQSMKGVKAARVHIVLPDQGSFRRASQPPSASVVIRTDGGSVPPSAQAIRHLVAAAIPGMALDQVTVLSTDGTILASGHDGANAAPSKMLELEKTISRDLQDKVRKTLAPYLGMGNFETSVTARLNLDKRQINETAYDPESRVERSVRVVRESGSQQNANSRWAVTVEQNVPEEGDGQKPGEQSKRQNERREELTNYEVNSKVTATVSEGYRIETLAVAVVVNRKRLVPAPGGATEPASAVEQQLKEVEQLVASAVGLDTQRGDKMTVSAVDFLDDGQLLEPLEAGSFWAGAGAIVNSLIIGAAMIGVTVLVILLVIRPMLRQPMDQLALASPGAPQASVAISAQSPQGQASPAPATGAASPSAPAQPALGGPASAKDESAPDYASAIRAKQGRAAIQRLEEVIEINEEHAAAVLKQWIRG